MSLRTTCPQCQRSVTAPDRYAGRDAKCPGCGGALHFPGDEAAAVLDSPAIAAGETDVAARDEIDCPFCAEPIRAAARKCKHCGEFLDPQAAIDAHENRLRAGGVQTVEATGKPWKLLQLIGGGLLVISTLLLAWGINVAISAPGTTVLTPDFWGTFGIGLGTYCVGRVGGWWFHG